MLLYITVSIALLLPSVSNYFTIAKLARRADVEAKLYLYDSGYSIVRGDQFRVFFAASNISC